MLQISKNKLLMMLLFVIYPVIPLYFGVAGISAFRLVALAIVGLWAVLSFPKFKGEIEIKRVVVEPIVCFFVYVLVMMMCYSYHQETLPLLYEIISYIVIIPIGVTFLKDKSNFLKAIDYLIAVATFVAVCGIVESFFGINVFEYLNNMGNTIVYNPLRFGMKRITAFTFQTISYCSYCMFVLSLIFYRLAGTQINKRGKYIAAYCLVAVNVILTLSRSMIICTIVCQVILLWCCGYKTFIKRMLIICLTMVVGFSILSMVAPQVGEILQSVGYMLLAVFNDDYAALLGNVDGTGVGDRADLFNWVQQKIEDDIWLGKGVSTPFSYSYTTTSKDGYSYIRTKTSLENQYLLLYYQHGIVGLIATVTAYASLLFQGIKKITRQKGSWEKRISFGQVALTTFLCYFVSFFSVHQIDEKRIFVCLIVLFISYCMNNKFDYYTE